MSIRRRSTAHDLAALCLHPDGSRVQQSSLNARQRTAKCTVVDVRGNWIAQDAGGQNSVKKRKSTRIAMDDGQECETIRLSPDGDDIDEDTKRAREHRRRSRRKGKQRAVEGGEQESDVEREQLDARTKRRLSFMQDLSFLDPPEEIVSELDNPNGISFPPPASELLKSIHHFASCYYRERGQLSDSGRLYREEKKKSRHNAHVLATDKIKQESLKADEETWKDVEEESGGDDAEDGGDNVPGDQGTFSANPNTKDMYKAFDGSALMAIGWVLYYKSKLRIYLRHQQGCMQVQKDDHYERTDPTIPLVSSTDVHDIQGTCLCLMVHIEQAMSTLQLIEAILHEEPV